MLQRERDFFAAFADLQLFLIELNLVVRLNSEGTLLAPCLVAEQGSAQRNHPKGPSHCGFRS
jgi:hypothetical protein